ncbi:glycosyltransferase [Longilinea arvoryzae]|uniref:Glycosyltransferase n=1 Tax=Longilinea arvoryzae TaxID=360412 RepID=A0A0S7BJB4_9CHLR|nr:glycosyltransferase [Longilinea arvoryzae]GAP13953.1 glycosyltransferase [Longilinea arvoryzae]
MPVEQIIFFTHNRVPTAHEQIRVFSPLKKAGMEILQGVQGDKLNLEGIQDAQLVLFQRDFSRKFAEYQSVMMRAHEVGVPVVLDLDDHLLALPTNHPDRLSKVFTGSLVALFCAIMEVDAITVTSPALKEVLEPYNPNIYVLPNYLDADIWHFRQPEPASNPDPTRILFMGTPTHRPDLEMISDALVNVAEKYNDHISFIFCGAEPPEELAGYKNTRYIPMQIQGYQAFVNEIQKIEADIAIAPLDNNLFNRCKSSLKYLEYSAMGLPGIYSKVTPYSAVIDDGKMGYLAESNDEWEEKLRLLVEDRSKRQDMVFQAQEDLRDNWMIENHAIDWNNAFDQIKSKNNFTDSGAHPYWMILNSIATQLEEDEARFQSLEDLRRIISSQGQEIDEMRKKNLVISLENQNLSTALDATRLEVVNYALSTSWRITRPLRKLGRYLRRL